MIAKFKDKLKKEGRTLIWFYREFVQCPSGIGYSGFTAQLNGYSPMSKEVTAQIDKFMEK